MPLVNSGYVRAMGQIDLQILHLIEAAVVKVPSVLRHMREEGTTLSPYIAPHIAKKPSRMSGDPSNDCKRDTPCATGQLRPIWVLPVRKLRSVCNG